MRKMKTHLACTPHMKSVRDYFGRLERMMHVGGMENGKISSKLGTVTAELEETKQSLEKAKEESMIMANCLSSLKEELERTKRELKQLKVHEAEMEPEIEHVKVVEDSTKFEVKIQSKEEEEEEEGIDFQKKRYVTFANPPSLAHVIIPALERHPSLRKKNKKKALIPLIGGIFSKKKASQKLTSP
ncbi:WEB family protein At1g75720-like isoform X2 [Hevea brasiliensis]|uniref:WEB family protein At1g75720-like isoform X2 n=1 Tax=Hevea brasiliensis TaxID=3981 RepID=UPI002600FEA7|nr:WEB family protein At1g75720-like isoform X2 [Hevea brasiliensis]